MVTVGAPWCGSSEGSGAAGVGGCGETPGAVMEGVKKYRRETGAMGSPDLFILTGIEVPELSGHLGMDEPVRSDRSGDLKGLSCHGRRAPKCTRCECGPVSITDG